MLLIGYNEVVIEIRRYTTVYYGKTETACVLLLCGGDKRKQPADIKNARACWKDYKKRTEVE